MNRKHLLSFLLILWLFASCSSTKHLKENEYMLTKNAVVMEDVKGQEFDDLVYLLRPEINRKFASVINMKTMIYASFQPKVKKDGTEKDSTFRAWMRKRGEEPVLLDSIQIENSISQLKIAMKKKGFFEAEIAPEVVFKRNQKVQVSYHVTANAPYFVREINYNVSIPEFRRIILLDTANSLLKKGVRYDEELILQERSRITSLIRNVGYYYVNNALITVEVDTLYSCSLLDKNQNKTLALDILVNFDNYKNPEQKEQALYKYTFNTVYIHSNYQLNSDLVSYDTTSFYSHRNKSDSTTYYFITIEDSNRKETNKPYRDFKYKTLTDIIYTKNGVLYSPSHYDRSYRRLNELNNFNIINIEFIEDPTKRDTLKKEGVLDVRYRLTRSKLHTFAAEFDIRSDKTNLSFTYSNKNIFKGAERLNINAYGGIYYYNIFLKRNDDRNPKKVYGDVGGSISLDLPRLFVFKQTQNIEAIRYSTSIKFAGNYNEYFKRLMLSASLTYQWSPNYNISHSLTPISISTIDTSRSVVRSIENYPSEYKAKFGKNLLMALNYNFNYLYPFKNKQHNFRLSVNFESSGALLLGLNKLDNMVQKRDTIWNILGYQYATYEMAELTLRYTYTINSKNSIATRFNLGTVIPFYDFYNNVVPFERSLYLGGANSMRAWGFRSLGPGSYYNDQYIERTGDLKVELNLEYRGTIYKAFKYGIFVDMGNIWMLREYAEMPGANFKFDSFYKEIALGVGAGIRLDFKFFLIRLDYGIPLYNPNVPEGYSRWINSSWRTGDKPFWRIGQGFQFAIGHAF